MYVLEDLWRGELHPNELPPIRRDQPTTVRKISASEEGLHTGRICTNTNAVNWNYIIIIVYWCADMISDHYASTLSCQPGNAI